MIGAPRAISMMPRADANDPKLEFRVVLPRERDHEYEIEDFGDEWIIRTNWQAKNFRVVRASMNRVADRAAWRDVIAHRSDGFVHGFAVFKNFLAVNDRSVALADLSGDGAEELRARMAGH